MDSRLRTVSFPKRLRRQRQIGDHKQVQNVVPVHEQELTALRSVELVPEPVSGRFSDLRTGDNECMIVRSEICT